MPRIVVSPLAQADVDEIWDYITRDSIPNADRFVDRIEQRFDFLADNTWGGGRARRSSTRSATLRARTPTSSPIDAIPGGIEVVRVVHGARDEAALWRR